MKDMKTAGKNLHTFNIDFKSEIDDVHYQGAFTVKRLGIADLAALGVRKAQLNGGYHHDPKNPGRGVDADTDEMNAILAHLDVCLVKAPTWWDLSNVSDMGLLYAIYQEVMAFESSFRGRGPLGSVESGKEDSETERTVSGQSPSAREVVGGEVQASLEP